MLAGLALLVTVQPLQAAAPQPVTEIERTLGLQCEDGVCRAELDLGLDAEMGWLPQGAWLAVMEGALRHLPGGMGLEVQEDVTISLPTGDLLLADADLVLTLDEAGRVATVRGSATAPVPTFGLLGDWQVVTPARVSVGYDRGASLTAFNAPLQAERRYFFIDAEAGLHLSTSSMALVSDAGQRATLIVDLAAPMLFVDGHVTLYTDGQLAFVREALGPLGESGWMPTDLPLRQQVQFHLQGQVGRDVEPKLTVASGYALDAGMVGQWLQLEATPLRAEGQAVISADGLLLEGTARSTIQPAQFFDAGAQAQLFVPFAAPETAAVTVGAAVTIPPLDVDENATATVAGEAGWLAESGQVAWSGIQQGWHGMGAAMHTGYVWAGEGVGTGWAYTQAQWCGLTGMCDWAQEVTRVATAE
jgi:prepilin-type processing-associated H-X9-DG protein